MKANDFRQEENCNLEDYGKTQLRRLRMPRWRTTLVLLCVAAGGCVSIPLPHYDPSADLSDQAVPVATVSAVFPEDHRFLIEPLPGLFEEENEVAERYLAAWLESRGWEVADLDHAGSVFRRARAGKNVFDGSGCGLPLSRWAAAERYADLLGSDGKMVSRISCRNTESCTLIVSLIQTRRHETNGGAPSLKFKASFDPALPWMDALTQAIESLEADDKSEMGGLGGLGVRGFGSIDVVEAHPETLLFSVRPVRPGHEPGESLREKALIFEEGGANRLAQCFDTKMVDEALVAIDEAGGLSGCRPRGAEHPEALCACDVLEAHGLLREGVNAERAVIGISFRPATTVTTWGGVVNAGAQKVRVKTETPAGDRWLPLVSDPSIAYWMLPSDDLVAACFADAGERNKWTARLRVTFDDLGEAQSAEVTATGFCEPTDAQVACLERVFLLSRAPCPAVSGATAEAEVFVELRPIGEPLDTPFEEFEPLSMNLSNM